MIHQKPKKKQLQHMQRALELAKAMHTPEAIALAERRLLIAIARLKAKGLA